MDVMQLRVCSTVPPVVEQEAAEAVGLRDWYWEPGETIKIGFVNGTEALQTHIRDTAEQWTQYANLSFDFDFSDRPPQDADIIIQFWAYGGGQSQVGRYSRTVARTGQVTMYLPQSGDPGVVLHEFGHALGLMHEHMNPVANIQWNRDAVYEYYRTVHDWDADMVNRNVLAQLGADQTNYTVFDPKSIMLYEIDASLTLDGFSVGRNRELSETDIRFIREVYPGR